MEVRKATILNIKEIKNLIDSLQVTRQQGGWKRATSGLFEYSKTEEELRRAINEHFLVAESSGRITGYGLAYSHRLFRHQNNGTDLPEFRFILDEVQEPYLYVDQMGVENYNSLFGARVARALAERGIKLATEAKLEKIVAFVCKQPVFNSRSDAFLQKCGLKEFEEVDIGKGIVLGAYKGKL